MMHTPPNYNLGCALLLEGWYALAACAENGESRMDIYCAIWAPRIPIQTLRAWLHMVERAEHGDTIL